jgi:hypothetical protein
MQLTITLVDLGELCAASLLRVALTAANMHLQVTP